MTEYIGFYYLLSFRVKGLHFINDFFFLHVFKDTCLGSLRVLVNKSTSAYNWQVHLWRCWLAKIFNKKT
jgi:hypothetical protein